jgi:hypothetical protein
MLVNLISADKVEGENTEDSVQIDKLSKFIDFYNYVPVMIHKIRHKNDTSDDLGIFMGKV